jgi:hypothetical protein
MDSMDWNTDEGVHVPPISSFDLAWINSDIPEEDKVHLANDSLTVRLPRFASHCNRPSFGQAVHKLAAHHLVIEALSTSGVVDFPTVTEICEGVAGNPDEMAVVAQLLSAAMQKGAAGSEESLPLLLKALTIANELLYDSEARSALVEAPGLLATVKHLHMRHRQQARSRQTASSGPAAECVRLLTSEICRSLDVSFVCRL